MKSGTSSWWSLNQTYSAVNARAFTGGAQTQLQLITKVACSLLHSWKTAKKVALKSHVLLNEANCAVSKVQSHS